jgi:hypothetical protein
MHYILDDAGEPQGATLEQWAKWFAHASRRLESTPIGRPPKLYVSTIFTGLDRAWLRYGAPILWETQVLAANRDDAAANRAGPDVGRTQRYTTRADALAGHWDLVAELRAQYEPQQEATR